MRCPNCNKENDQNAIFCAKCGAWILGEVYEKPEAPAPEAPAAKPAPVTPSEKSNLRFILPTIAALCLVILLAVWLLPGQVPQDATTAPPTPAPTTTAPPIPTEPAETSPFVYWQGCIQFRRLDGELVVLADDQLLKIGTGDSYVSNQISMDQSAAAFQNEDGSLYYVHDGQIRKFAEDGASFSLSALGGGVAYKDADGALWLYRADTQVKRRIAGSSCEDFAISPDGGTVAYIDTVGTKKYLHCWTDGNDVTLGKLINNSGLPISVSDGGTCIYYLDGIALCAYDAAGQKYGLTTYTGSFTTYYLNADHTQILYTTGYGYYLSDNGSEQIKLYDEEIDIAFPRHYATMKSSISGAIRFTYGARDLRQCLYETYDIVTDENRSRTRQYTLWALRDDTLVPVQDNLLAYSYLPDISVVFLKRNDGHLYRWDMETDTLTLIAEDVGAFRCSDDGSQVYYDSDGMLYRCSGVDGSQAETISEIDAKLISNIHNGYLYWLQDSDLYACAPDGTVSLVLTGVTTFDFYSSAFIYADTENGIYIAADDGSFHLIES